MSRKLYHTTDAAVAILRDGFRNSTACYMAVEVSGANDLDVTPGVFVANYPCDINEGAKGDQVLEVTVPDDFDLSEHAIYEEGMVVWEWLIPASILNRWPVKLLSDGELEDLAVEEHARRRAEAQP